MTLLSGTNSTLESTLEPVTGVRNLTVESKSRYNDSLKVYESEVEDGTTKASVVIDIPGEAESNTDTNIQKVNGIHNINDEYDLLESMNNLKLNVSDRDELLKEL